MEHLNSVWKEAVLTLGANKTPNALQHVGYCVGALKSLLENYIQDTNVSCVSGYHTIAKDDNGRKIIIKELMEVAVFSYNDKRAHSCFKNIKINLIASTKRNEKFLKWMKKQLCIIQKSYV